MVNEIMRYMMLNYKKSDNRANVKIMRILAPGPVYQNCDRYYKTAVCIGVE